MKERLIVKGNNFIARGYSLLTVVFNHLRREGVSSGENDSIQSKSSAGFTLIEIVMVITIVGIVATLSAPKFNNFYAVKLEGASKKLVSDIRYTQQLAVARHTDCQIVFDAANERYDVYEYDQGSDSWVSVTDPFSRSNLSVDFTNHSQYRGLDIQNPDFNGSSLLLFNWQGIPQSVGSVVLVYNGISRITSVRADSGITTDREPDAIDLIPVVVMSILSEEYEGGAPEEYEGGVFIIYP